MSIEEIIAKKVVAAIMPKLDALDKKMDALKAREKTVEERLNFLLPEEAEARLKVSRPTLNKLIKDGELKVSVSPGGRVKILDISINEYIAKEVGL